MPLDGFDPARTDAVLAEDGRDFHLLLHTSEPEGVRHATGRLSPNFRGFAERLRDPSVNLPAPRLDSHLVPGVGSRPAFVGGPAGFGSCWYSGVGPSRAGFVAWDGDAEGRAAADFGEPSTICLALASAEDRWVGLGSTGATPRMPYRYSLAVAEPDGSTTRIPLSLGVRRSEAFGLAAVDDDVITLVPTGTELRLRRIDLDDGQVVGAHDEPFLSRVVQADVAVSGNRVALVFANIVSPGPPFDFDFALWTRRFDAQLRPLGPARRLDGTDREPGGETAEVDIERSRAAGSWRGTRPGRRETNATPVTTASRSSPTSGRRRPCSGPWVRVG